MLDIFTDVVLEYIVSFATHWDSCHTQVQKSTKAKPGSGDFHITNTRFSMTGNARIISLSIYIISYSIGIFIM